MKKTNHKTLCAAIILLVLFVAWTVLLCFVNVKAIGPQESAVGFAAINKAFHEFIGVNMTLYAITDWLGLVPIGFALGFAFFGLAQWFKRKSIKKVDADIILLGGFYLVIIAVYILFECLAINYRPVLINSVLEISYPSSTTLLASCVMLTAAIQFNRRIKNGVLKHVICSLIAAFVVFMIVGRLVSGVHWFTDVVGGVLFSLGLVLLYAFSID